MRLTKEPLEARVVLTDNAENEVVAEINSDPVTGTIYGGEALREKLRAGGGKRRLFVSFRKLRHTGQQRIPGRGTVGKPEKNCGWLPDRAEEYLF